MSEVTFESNWATIEPVYDSFGQAVGGLSIRHYGSFEIEEAGIRITSLKADIKLINSFPTYQGNGYDFSVGVYSHSVDAHGNKIGDTVCLATSGNFYGYLGVVGYGEYPGVQEITYDALSEAIKNLLIVPASGDNGVKVIIQARILGREYSWFAPYNGLDFWGAITEYTSTKSGAPKPPIINITKYPNDDTPNTAEVTWHLDPDFGEKTAEDYDGDGNPDPKLMPYTAVVFRCEEQKGENGEPGEVILTEVRRYGVKGYDETECEVVTADRTEEQIRSDGKKPIHQYAETWADIYGENNTSITTIDNDLQDNKKYRYVVKAGNRAGTAQTITDSFAITRQVTPEIVNSFYSKNGKIYGDIYANNYRYDYRVIGDGDFTGKYTELDSIIKNNSSQQIALKIKVITKQADETTTILGIDNGVEYFVTNIYVPWININKNYSKE